MYISPEMRASVISEINGTDYTGDGSEENPFIAVEGTENLENLITKVLIYARLFKVILFFSYEGITANYDPDPEKRVFSVETDRKNSLKIAVRNILKGSSRGIKVVESNPLLQIVE
jgi:hypothetical protein